MIARNGATLDVDTVTVKNMSTKEILDRLERRCQERFGTSAQEFVRFYQDGKIECPGEFADMLALVRLLPREHEIFGGR